MIDSAVRFNHVQKSYDGETLVVKDLNLTIERGEFLTMLGPSGSGKTTCLMMLAGFETPTGGQILLGDRSINKIPPHKRNIGMVFQDYALFPHKTVAENLAYPLKVRKFGRSEIETRVKQALDMVRLGSFANRKPGMLSGGQQQRVAVARALVFDPEIVLMDEPLGALDKQLREQMQYEIKHIHQNLGLTFVYVTHDQTEALTMSDRIAVFNDGVVQQLAPPDQLYETPENSFVAQFIGENNTLDGVIDSINGAIAVVRLSDGTLIDALPVNVSAPGEKTKVSIRPERVEINPKRLSDRVYTMEAKVKECIYMGDIYRTRLRVGDHEDFIIKTRNASDQQPLTPGEKINIGWLPQDCRALDA